MSVARLSRDRKRQLGQYLTPQATAAAIVRKLELSPGLRILEPSFGEGAFLWEILDALSSTLSRDEFRIWCATHLYGCEIDNAAYDTFRGAWHSRGLGEVPNSLACCDFFTWLPPGCDKTAATDEHRYFASRLEYFDLILGNPPFGGSINPDMQDDLDAIFGMRGGKKIKKETYAFFIVKAVDLLKPGGRLVFICSDTLLTIATMTGLRHWLHTHCDIQISEVPGCFADTHQEMLLLTLTKQPAKASQVTVFDRVVPLSEVESTPNMSWRVDSELARYFTGVTLGDKMVATSGMTIGNNDLFLRQIIDGRIEEPYTFAFIEQKITVEREVSCARLGKVSARRLRTLRVLEERGVRERAITWDRMSAPQSIALPNDDYCYYNKASSQIIYSEPAWVIFWRDNGEYVYTFKKTGNWYLRGVGGMKYFRREGLTWALIAPRLYARYLPEGYILDSGAPCAFLRHGIESDELFFILGWALTDLCPHILKSVLNHTRNIQSKDFERLPYPVWVDPDSKQKAIFVVKSLLNRAKAGQLFTFKSDEVKELNGLYAWRGSYMSDAAKNRRDVQQLSLL